MQTIDRGASGVEVLERKPYRHKGVHPMARAFNIWMIRFLLQISAYLADHPSQRLEGEQNSSSLQSSL